MKELSYIEIEKAFKPVISLNNNGIIRLDIVNILDDEKRDVDKIGIAFGGGDKKK